MSEPEKQGVKTVSGPNASLQRLALYGVALLCLVLLGYAGLRAAGDVAAARTAALFEVEQAVAQATAARIEQDRIPDRLIVSVEALIGERALGLNYLTLRNADGVTLVSRGRFRARFDWLPTDWARRLRGWSYQLQSAEANRALSRDAQRVGYAQFGIGWSTVLGRAGLSLLIWATAALAGLVGFAGALIASSAMPQRERASSTGDKRTRIRERAVPPASAGEKARSPLSRLTRRGEGAADEFTPIVDRRTRTARADEAKDQPPAVEPAREARTPSPPPAPPGKARRPPETPINAPKPQGADEAAVSAQARPFEPAGAPAAKPAASAPDEPARSALHVPRLDAQPSLGDDTLDLRFYPIWSGAKREVLAGACAALAWRVGETRLADADTLTRLAERDGALRAFTQWIARRFSLLHSNWRTLELDTVPIVLPVPSPMLAFADAETVWRDALRRIDRDPNDLILWLGSRSRRYTHSTLPVRRALGITEPNAALPADCDVVCIKPADIGEAVEAWHERIESLDSPVLIGPVESAEPLARLLAHERVLWFSDDESDLYAPRAFARLLARHRTRAM